MGRGRLLIAGWYGHRNTGDEAILSGLLRGIRSRWPQLCVTVLSGRPCDTEREHRVKAVYGWSLRSLIREISRTDFLLIGGGSPIFDTFDMRPIRYWLGMMSVACSLGKPFGMIGSVGPFRRPASVRLAALALGRTQFLSLRDEDSYRYAHEQLHLPSGKLTLASDLAFGMEPADTEWARQHSFPCHERCLIGVALRSWPPYDMPAAARTLAGSLPPEALPVLLPLDRAEDDAAILDIFRDAWGGDVLTLPDSLGVTQVAGVIQALDFLVSVRLHGLVLGAMGGVPGIALAYASKVVSLGREIGYPVVSLTDVAPAGLRDHVVRALCNADEIRTSVNLNVPRLRLRSELSFDALGRALQKCRLL